MKKYAGIGSRRTPEDILQLMSEIANILEKLGWHLNTGAAPGADQAFAQGCANDYTLFIPWYGYEREFVQISGCEDVVVLDSKEHVDAFRSVEEFHPAFSKLTSGALKLHARNYLIMQDVSMVICYTPNGQASGGTGQAMRLAKSMGIPIYNLYNYEDRYKLYNILVGEIIKFKPSHAADFGREGWWQLVGHVLLELAWKFKEERKIPRFTEIGVKFVTREQCLADKLGIRYAFCDKELADELGLFPVTKHVAVPYGEAKRIEANYPDAITMARRAQLLFTPATSSGKSSFSTKIAGITHLEEHQDGMGYVSRSDLIKAGIDPSAAIQVRGLVLRTDGALMKSNQKNMVDPMYKGYGVIKGMLIPHDGPTIIDESQIKGFGKEYPKAGDTIEFIVVEKKNYYQTKIGVQYLMLRSAKANKRDLEYFMNEVLPGLIQQTPVDWLNGIATRGGDGNEEKNDFTTLASEVYDKFEGLRHSKFIAYNIVRTIQSTYRVMVRSLGIKTLAFKAAAGRKLNKGQCLVPANFGFRIGETVEVYRNPLVQSKGIKVFKIKGFTNDGTIRINMRAAKDMDCDFDGDTLVLRPIIDGHKYSPRMDLSLVRYDHTDPKVANLYNRKIDFCDIPEVVNESGKSLIGKFILLLMRSVIDGDLKETKAFRFFRGSEKSLRASIATLAQIEVQGFKKEFQLSDDFAFLKEMVNVMDYKKFQDALPSFKSYFDIAEGKTEPRKVWGKVYAVCNEEDNGGNYMFIPQAVIRTMSKVLSVIPWAVDDQRLIGYFGSSVAPKNDKMEKWESINRDYNKAIRIRNADQRMAAFSILSQRVAKFSELITKEEAAWIWDRSHSASFRGTARGLVYRLATYVFTADDVNITVKPVNDVNVKLTSTIMVGKTYSIDGQNIMDGSKKIGYIYPDHMIYIGNGKNITVKRVVNKKSYSVVTVIIDDNGKNNGGNNPPVDDDPLSFIYENNKKEEKASSPLDFIFEDTSNKETNQASNSSGLGFLNKKEDGEDNTRSLNKEGKGALDFLFDNAPVEDTSTPSTEGSELGFLASSPEENKTSASGESDLSFLSAPLEEDHKIEEATSSTISIYIDGSWSSNNPEVVGYGLVAEDGYRESGTASKETASMHQIAGEMKAAMCAVSYALKKGYSHVIIKHDYMGVSKWVTGEWKPKKIHTKQYASWMKAKMADINISFAKVSAGSNPADDEARKATGANYAH